MSTGTLKLPAPVSIEAPRSRYSQIADVIRRRIDDATYPPGSQLPSEEQLAAEFDVSRVTINKAVWSLRAAGFVRVRRGAGTVVRATPQIVRDARRWHEQRYDATGAGQLQASRLGLTAHTQYVWIGRASAPPQVARLLRLPPAAPVLERQQRLFTNDKPTQLAESYLPWSIAKDCPALFEHDAGPGRSDARLADLGYEPSHFAEDIKVRAATDLEARALDLDSPQPVFEILRTAFSADGTPVEVTLHVLPGSTWTLHYEWGDGESSR